MSADHKKPDEVKKPIELKDKPTETKKPEKPVFSALQPKDNPPVTGDIIDPIASKQPKDELPLDMHVKGDREEAYKRGYITKAQLDMLDNPNTILNIKK